MTGMAERHGQEWTNGHIIGQLWTRLDKSLGKHIAVLGTLNSSSSLILMPYDLGS